MAIETPLTKLLGIRHPVVLAPMGAVSGGKLAAAVTRAGGLGLLGPGYLGADWIEREFAASFLQALFMLEILGPVFEQIELGSLPGPRERMRSMMVAYGFWETNIALEFSNGRTRLPPGLFGGIKELRLQ